MTQEQWTAVDGYINDLFVPYDAVLEAALQASRAAGLPGIHVSPTQGKLLYLLAQLQPARNILEIGTLAGYSTIWLGRALVDRQQRRLSEATEGPPAQFCLGEKSGRVITLEVDQKHAEVALANIARAEIADVVELRAGQALVTLPQLAAEGRGPFDLIFIDADKENYSEYFSWALRLSRPGTLIIADNVVRKGTVIEAGSDDPSVQGVRRFNELVAAEKRVSATVIQTVGSKGYDGLAIALVTGGEQ